MQSELKPCPVCGKQPNVTIDYAYEESGFGGWVTIQCKPLFRKPHLKVEEGKSNNARALKYAIAAWNRRANHIRDTTKKVSNADSVRSMSDEELAKFLWEINGSNQYWKSIDKYLDWLQQPAKEEHHEAD